MSTLTIEQLRAYLERREREASEAADQARARHRQVKNDEIEALKRWDVYVTANARANLYRELLAVIETGEVPE